MMLVIISEQIFLLYFDAGGRSFLIGDRLENCWLATSNSCTKLCFIKKSLASYRSPTALKRHKNNFLHFAFLHLVDD